MSSAVEPALVIESTAIKVPFESLKRTTRDRKYAIDQLKDTLAQLNGAATPPAPRALVIHRLEEAMRSLQHLKRKLDDAGRAERDDAQRCRARLEHLQELGRPARDAHIDWNRRRMFRLLVDHMLRCGYLEAATALAHKEGDADLTDLHIFKAAQPVLDSLRRRECGAALEWCAVHAVRLRKVRSPLEFRLRVQEFVELARAGDLRGGIAYARQHLSRWAEQYPAETQRAAALLAFRLDTACAPYAALLAEQRWEDLVALFRAELFRLHSLPPASLLEVHLQAGLSALKTQNSLSPSCGPRDPLHLPTFRRLAQDLPFAKHVHSKLLCALSGEVISEHNPPMALPNGYVYSQAALEAMAGSNEGRITCPHTGATYTLGDLRRVFVM